MLFAHHSCYENKCQKPHASQRQHVAFVYFVSLLYRAATTNYLCCDQALEDSKGAGRIGLTRFVLRVQRYTYFSKMQYLKPFFSRVHLTLTEIQRATYNIIFNFAHQNEESMQTKKGNMQQYAMIFGTYMGIFWILKFALIPLGLTHPFLSLLFICLTICVPFMGYYYTRLYRDRVCGGVIPFMHAWSFNILMYMCAALLTAIAHYVYFQYIDEGYILNTCRETLETLMSTPGMEVNSGQIKQALETMERLTPVDIMLNMLQTNVFFCVLLGIPTALLVMRNKPKDNLYIPNEQ